LLARSVATSNGRLLGLEEGRVRFRWRDSKDHDRIKEVPLDAVEFIRRFLLTDVVALVLNCRRSLGKQRDRKPQPNRAG
jgi:hypothetical protein